MSKLASLSLAISLAAATAAIAQTSSPTAPPANQPSTTPPASAPSTTAPSTSTPSATMPSSTTASPTTASKDVVLTEEEAKQWIDKTVYSADNKNVGEVAAFKRDSSGKVIELHADVGGFLGIGERRVKLMPSQFSLQGDRVMLNVTSNEVKAMPAIPKS